jgi:N-sulfoglucosamine sulfohydrolase
MRYPIMKMSMRFIAVALALFAVCLIGGTASEARANQPAERPNILWITCEDISAHLGCYGDEYAVTPNLDHLASQSVLYTNAFANIGVCAPARSCLITGMYPPSIGTQHMRCQGTLPNNVFTYSHYLRQAGYYCTNNVKTDYNFRHRPDSWDESSRQAHWRNRGKDQPFFAIFNFTSSHESRIRQPEQAYRRMIADFTPEEIHDPAKAPIPPYHPDTPEVRKDWARYHDTITYMDKEVAGVLAQLEEDGLADNTIVFYYSDHGAGMPRSKRWLYDSSLHVPMFIRFPEKFQHLAPGKPGTKTDRLVSFVDFGPTALSLAGVPVPAHMQGEAFLGEQTAESRQYIYGYRDRMDERYDMIRAVRDKQYKYIRNYMPHLPWFHHQHISYMYQMPTMQVWQKLADAGQLSGPQAVFMTESKPMEELYDITADPHEVNNLADSAEHQAVLGRMRAAHREWMKDIIDLGLLPEADLRARFGNEPPYDAVRRDPSLYPMQRIAAAADLANRRDPASVSQLTALLDDEDPAVRYWGAIGLGALGKQAESAASKLNEKLADSAGWVQVAAADALCRMDRYDRAVPVLTESLKHDNDWVRLQAINIVDRIGERGRPALPVLKEALDDSNGYVGRVAEHAVERLGSE